MRIFTLLCVLVGVFNNANAQDLHKADSFSYFKTEGSGQGKALVYLHGSVRYFVNVEAEQTQISDLIEGNPEFLNSFNEYSIFMPVATKSFNWLQTARVSSLFDNIPELSGFDTLIIAGFSDGGTGAYRMFYCAPDSFDGLVVFNGYPQLGWFNKNVDYSLNANKPVVFVSQNKDKVIRYEFLMTEYRIQKSFNPQTYLYITKGKHRFASYSKEDFRNVSGCLSRGIRPTFDQMYLPIDGFVLQNVVREMYCFRDRIGRKYGIKKEYLSANPSRRDIRRLNGFNSNSCLRRKSYSIRFVEVAIVENKVSLSRSLKLVGCSWDKECKFKISVPNVMLNEAF